MSVFNIASRSLMMSPYIIGIAAVLLDKLPNGAWIDLLLPSTDSLAGLSQGKETLIFPVFYALATVIVLFVMQGVLRKAKHRPRFYEA